MANLAGHAMRELWAAIDWEVVGKLAAVASAIFSAYAAYNSRQLVVSLISSQRLSIRPLVQISFGDYDDRLYVSIENHGLGPMIIENVSVVKAGVEVGGSLVYAKDFPFIERYVDDFVRDFGGRAVQHGGDALIFRAKGEISDPEFQDYLNQLRKYLSDVEFLVAFKDMYDVKQEPARRNGSWFARHFQQEIGDASSMRAVSPPASASK